MTPAEWDSSADPDAMLAAAADRISDRKLLLFGTAAARRVADVLPLFVTTLLPQVEAAADAPTAEERAALLRAAVHSTGSTVAAALVSVRSNASTRTVVRTAATWLRGLEAQGGTTPLLANIASVFTAPFVHRPSPEQAALLRCAAGYPFAPPAFDTAWRTSTVEALARGIDADAAFDRLPILADALMDAGCGDDRLLAHLRSPGPHARGCWPLDLVLGNS